MPIDQPMIQVSQEGETPAVFSSAPGGFSYRYAYSRSADSRANQDRGQDFIAFREDGSRLAFAVCDGVSQSYFGDLAAQFLGHNLVDWLWSRADGEGTPESAGQELADFLTGLTSEASRIVNSHRYPEDIPGMLQSVLEKKRQQGSESTFVTGLIDLRRGAYLFAWMGDTRLRYWDGAGEQTLGLGDTFLTRERWSTRKGPVGRPHVHYGAAADLRHLMAYTDGLSILDQAVTGSGCSDAAVNLLIEEAQRMPASDDNALFEWWRERPGFGSPPPAVQEISARGSHISWAASPLADCYEVTLHRGDSSKIDACWVAQPPAEFDAALLPGASSVSVRPWGKDEPGPRQALALEYAESAGGGLAGGIPGAGLPGGQPARVEDVPGLPIAAPDGPRLAARPQRAPAAPPTLAPSGRPVELPAGKARAGAGRRAPRAGTLHNRPLNIILAGFVPVLAIGLIAAGFLAATGQFPALTAPEQVAAAASQTPPGGALSAAQTEQALAAGAAVIAPETSPTAAATETPAAIDTPEAIVTPVVTASPEATATPVVTASPEATASPVAPTPEITANLSQAAPITAGSLASLAGAPAAELPADKTPVEVLLAPPQEGQAGQLFRALVLFQAAEGQPGSAILYGVDSAGIWVPRGDPLAYHRLAAYSGEYAALLDETDPKAGQIRLLSPSAEGWKEAAKTSTGGQAVCALLMDGSDLYTLESNGRIVSYAAGAAQPAQPREIRPGAGWNAGLPRGFACTLSLDTDGQGRRWLAASVDMRLRIVNLADVVGGKETAALGNPITGVRYGGQRWWISGKGVMRVLDEEWLARNPLGVTHSDFDLRGDLLVTVINRKEYPAYESCSYFDLSRGAQNEETYQAVNVKVDYCNAQVVHFSPDGRFLVTISPKGQVTVWFAGRQK